MKKKKKEIESCLSLIETQYSNSKFENEANNVIQFLLSAIEFQNFQSTILSLEKKISTLSDSNEKITKDFKSLKFLSEKQNKENINAISSLIIEKMILSIELNFELSQKKILENDLKDVRDSVLGD